jgi:nucleoid-associated protein YgaU
MQARTRKNRPKTHVESSDEGEAFDAVSDTSSVDDEPLVMAAQPAPTRAKRAGRAGRAAPTVPSSATPAAHGPPIAGSSMAHDASEQPLLQPFLPTTDSSRSNRAHDTKYFFLRDEILEKGSKVMKQICRVCQ